jgi:hypothetical protein
MIPAAAPAGRSRGGFGYRFSETLNPEKITHISFSHRCTPKPGNCRAIPPREAPVREASLRFSRQAIFIDGREPAFMFVLTGRT